MFAINDVRISNERHQGLLEGHVHLRWDGLGGMCGGGEGRGMRSLQKRESSLTGKMTSE